MDSKPGTTGPFWESHYGKEQIGPSFPHLCAARVNNLSAETQNWVDHLPTDLLKHFRISWTDSRTGAARRQFWRKWMLSRAVKLFNIFPKYRSRGCKSRLSLKLVSFPTHSLYWRIFDQKITMTKWRVSWECPDKNSSANKLATAHQKLRKQRSTYTSICLGFLLIKYLIIF